MAFKLIALLSSKAILLSSGVVVLLMMLVAVNGYSESDVRGSWCVWRYVGLIRVAARANNKANEAELRYRRCRSRS